MIHLWHLIFKEFVLFSLQCRSLVWPYQRALKLISGKGRDNFQYLSVWLFATRGLGWGEREVETIGDRLPLFYCPCIRLNNPTPQFHLNSTQGVDSHSKAEVLVLSFVKRTKYHLNPSSSPALNILVAQKQFPALSKVPQI